LKRLKKRGSEDKWFWSTSEADVIRSISSEARSPEADSIRSSEDHQELKELKLQRLFKGSNHAFHCRRLEAWSNG